MPRYLRARTGSTYFFTVVSYHRRPILCTESIRQSLRIAIDKLRPIRPFSIDAWVLLPDHMHCVWTLPEGDHDFSTRWLMIKRSVSRFSQDVALDPEQRTASARKHRESTIWQRRFWEHQVRDQLDFERHIDYIHDNPVRHGHVERAVDWPYSTIYRYVKKGIYPPDWGGSADKARGDFE